ncbi:MAG: DUF3024 domain-containing protein [Nitrospirae bacterium]|nr:DUF3024 domain-containing protein [Nitrospirota bacterium]MBI4849252.1 DUF3024 domain-containing protein [Nitrospirota bacterium]
MPLPVLVKTLIEKKVGDYCTKKAPPHVLDKLKISYNIRGNSVTIFENRAPWHPDMKEWTSMPVAQMRYDNKTGEWTLYCADRNDRWHKYMGIKPTKDIDIILTEIDKDPTGIFWG